MHSAVMTHALSSEACVGGVCPVAGIAHTQEFAELLVLDSSVCHRGKRDLLQRQKRPTIEAKETYYRGAAGVG
jgi:hypothetical protein